MVADCTESEGLRITERQANSPQRRTDSFGRNKPMEEHQVRLLCRCPVCGKLGDQQAMVKVGPMKTPAHDRCAFEQLGDGIMNLPQEERVKFGLVAVGPDMMRRLVDAAG